MATAVPAGVPLDGEAGPGFPASASAPGPEPAPTTARGSSSSRRTNWDMIRVVAIVFVVAGHITGVASDVPGIEPYPVRIHLPFGTSTLLVLSGYFIGPTLCRGSVGHWFRARLARVLPAYLMAVLLVYTVTRATVVGFNGWRHEAGVLGFLFGSPVVPIGQTAATESLWHVPDPTELFLHLALLQDWIPAYHRIDGSYWTLPVQVLAFAAATVLCRWKPQRILGVAATLWTVLLVSAGSQALGLLLPALPTATGLYHAFLFAAGAAIWLWQRRRLSTLQLVLMLGAVLVLHGFRSSGPLVGTLGAFAVLLVAMCAAARGPDWNVGPLRMLQRPIAWLAGISYCLYLVHQQLGYVLARALVQAGVSPWWLRLSIVAASAVLAAWLLTVLVERPAYQTLTRSRIAAPGRSAPEA